MEKAYAQALHALLKGGMPEKEAFDKLKRHLEETGRLKLLPQLLGELRVLEERSQVKGPKLEVASEKEARHAEDAARKAGAEAHAIVNPSLISGWRLATADTLIDHSGKRALIDLYRTIIRS